MTFPKTAVKVVDAILRKRDGLGKGGASRTGVGFNKNDSAGVLSLFFPTTLAIEFHRFFP